MNPHALLQQISRYQSAFSRELVRALDWAPVSPDNIDEFLARLSIAFPPVFLPLFESEGDIFAVHLSPRSTDFRLYRLAHDETEPMLVASQLRFLARSLIRVPFYMSNDWTAVHPYAREMARDTGAEAVPPEDAYARYLKDLSPHFVASLDPTNGTARVDSLSWTEETIATARDALEALHHELPENAHISSALADARAAAGAADAFPLARSTLDVELVHGFALAVRYFVRGLSSSSEILERMREICAPSLDDSDVLAPLRDVKLTEIAGAKVLRDIALSLRGKDDRLALVYLRNAAWAVGRFAALTKEWCEDLAEQADRVEPGGLSAQVAAYAASVFSRGP